MLPTKAANLLARLRSQGLTLWPVPAEPDNPASQAWKIMIQPFSQLTDADRQEIAACREELLDLLFFEIPSVEPNGPGPGYFLAADGCTLRRSVPKVDLTADHVSSKATGPANGVSAAVNASARHLQTPPGPPGEVRRGVTAIAGTAQ